MAMRRAGGRLTPLVLGLLLGMILCDRSGACAVTALAALLHEAGHFLAARLLGIPLGRLRLGFRGARLEVKGRMLSYSEEWLLAAAGPIFSLLGAAGGALLWSSSEAARIFSCASLLLGLLNLLPIRSFDGGRMLAATLSACLSPRAVCAVLRGASFFCLSLLWMTAVYLLLRTGDGISLFCFSMSLFSAFFREAEEL